MPTRIIARESRLAASLSSLNLARARSREVPSTLIERQPRDRRAPRFDSSKPVAVVSMVSALSKQQGINAASIAATGSSADLYYGSGGYYFRFTGVF
jgi:hypothetical protein